MFADIYQASISINMKADGLQTVRTERELRVGSHTKSYRLQWRDEKEIVMIETEWPSELRMEKSKGLYDRAKKVMPGGITTGVAYWRSRDYPLYFSKAKGSRIWDVDGNQYVDCLCGEGLCKT